MPWRFRLANNRAYGCTVDECRLLFGDAAKLRTLRIEHSGFPLGN